MERDWLEEQLEAGRSIESIAREVMRDPSTVAYWVNRYGLVSVHAARHAMRGPLTREMLEPLVETGMTIRQIARELDRSASTVRHWLERYGLKTKAASRVRRDGSTAERVIRDCPAHGWTEFRRVGTQVQYRCARCVIAAVAHRRAIIRDILLEEAGGRCTLCGYARNSRALQSHHLDPTAKLFTLRNGNMRSLASMRAEAAKCVLLCANCHAEVESGSVSFPYHHLSVSPPG